MALTQKDKQELIDSVFETDIDIHLGTGEVVLENDDGSKYIMFDGHKLAVNNKEEYINIKYNEDVRDTIGEFLPTLLKARKIIDPSLVDQKTPAVNVALRKARSRNGTVSTTEKQMIINDISEQYSVQYQLAVFQIATWAMMRDHVFFYEGNNMGTIIDVDVDEEYWKATAREKKKVDPLRKLLNINDDRIKFVRDKSNPLELQIAIITQITNDYEDFSEDAMKVVGACLGGLTLSQNEDLGEIDDAGMFRLELLSYLPTVLRRDEPNEQGQLIKTRDRVLPSEDQQPSISGVEGEAI